MDKMTYSRRRFLRDSTLLALSAPFWTSAHAATPLAPASAYAGSLAGRLD
ncbi:hypothetical protein [Pectobacterium carotovorum]|nr:hypothetical protein LQF52_00770 [Pectobacterium carotovorum]